MPEKMTPAHIIPATSLLEGFSRREGAIATDRNNSMYWELLHGLGDLESTAFREHWYYRAAMFAVNTNAAKNPTRRWEHRHLMDRARDFEGENEIPWV